MIWLGWVLSEGQQDLSSIQDSPEYPRRSKQCFSLDSLNLSLRLPTFLAPLGAVPSAPIIIGITVTYIFHCSIIIIIIIILCIFILHLLFLFFLS